MCQYRLWPCQFGLVTNHNWHKKLENWHKNWHTYIYSIFFSKKLLFCLWEMSSTSLKIELARGTGTRFFIGEMVVLCQLWVFFLLQKKESLIFFCKAVFYRSNIFFCKCWKNGYQRLKKPYPGEMGQMKNEPLLQWKWEGFNYLGVWLITYWFY